ncbi:putative 2OG-Fe(II) oxygenase [Marilutibacter chinensis]|uniref:putative 2OG-Fe(II) oxygenase n=1 Tax=Marilutibacter chinensis TaxID=2912247 RepID=UPI001F469B63
MSGARGSAASPPAEVVARLREAWAALQRRQPTAAREAALAATRLAPDAFDAWRLLAVAEQGLGRSDACILALQHALALRPDDAGTALDLGTALLQSGDARAARTLLQQAMRTLPGDARAAFRYGTACYALGEMEQAAQGFAAATVRAPDWAEAWNNLAAALGQRQDYPAAIAAARNAVRLQPQAAPTHHALAALQSNLFDTASLREGLASVQRALALARDFADAHRIAAILHRKLGDPQRAERHAREALRLAPQDPAAVDTLGEQLLINGRPAEAASTYESALTRGVDTPVLRRQHGIALLQDGRTGAALEALDRALRQATDDQRAIAHLGVATALEHGAARADALLGLHRHVHRIALPAPDGFADAEAFHRALADDIRHHSRQRWEPAGLAARNAYLSGDLLADRTAAIAGFEQRLRAAIDAFIAGCRRDPDDPFLRNVPRDYVLHVWATQAAESGYIDTHIHEESWLSGAYYVTVPDAIGPEDPTHAGWIEFGRPYAGLPAVEAAALRLECPRAGDLLLFPSYLFHRTLPYRGDGERISVSFDLAAA